MDHASPDLNFRPTASWEMLRLRARILKGVRDFFDSRGFLEVETPILSADIVVDRHLDPFGTVLADDPRRPDMGQGFWLQTSPEFHMKRLMASGGEAIYQISRVFRNGEIGRLHNPEFTMVEWYRRGDDLNAGMGLLSDLTVACLGSQPAEQKTYADVFREQFGADALSAEPMQLRRLAASNNIPYPESLAADDRDAWLELLWTERVERNLGVHRPTIIYGYPASQAALARISSDDPRTAERFELYVHGIEVANGYHELLDANVLLERNARANQQRVADGKPPLPEHSRLIDAMRSGLPACTGVALGFDRLVMIAAGAKSLVDVIPFPIDRA